MALPLIARCLQVNVFSAPVLLPYKSQCVTMSALQGFCGRAGLQVVVTASRAAYAVLCRNLPENVPSLNSVSSYFVTAVQSHKTVCLVQATLLPSPSHFLPNISTFLGRLKPNVAIIMVRACIAAFCTNGQHCAQITPPYCATAHNLTAAFVHQQLPAAR